jgi:hypothetical protein
MSFQLTLTANPYNVDNVKLNGFELVLDIILDIIK